MPTPAAYLDECVDHELVAGLRQRGFTATSALEQDRANSAIDDADQLAFAAQHDLVLVSFNERHFRALSDAYQRNSRPYGGVIIVPASPPFDRVMIRVALMLDWLGTMTDHRSRLFKWGHLQGLLERGYRLPGYDEDEVRLALAR
jgi:hypothetical protein